MKKLTIITPCFNEEHNVVICAEAVRKVMNNQLRDFDYEHIFADNASTDSTAKKLRVMASEDPKIKIIINSRNVGPFRNVWNALKSASGNAIIPFLPADLQDPVDVIPEFVKRWEHGDLVVYGVRTKRQESWFMRSTRNIYYRVISHFAEADIPRNAGEFLLADKRVIDSILEVDDAYPYIRGLVAQTAVRSSFVEYRWAKRSNGKSRLRFVDLIDQGINGFVSTSRMPARITLLAGFSMAFLGIVGALITLILVIFGDKSITPGIPTIIVSIFVFGGVQLFFLGLIGEYVLSIHGQVRRIPSMFEVEKINF